MSNGDKKIYITSPSNTFQQLPGNQQRLREVSGQEILRYIVLICEY